MAREVTAAVRATVEAPRVVAVDAPAAATVGAGAVAAMAAVRAATTARLRNSASPLLGRASWPAEGSGLALVLPRRRDNQGRRSRSELYHRTSRADRPIPHARCMRGMCGAAHFVRRTSRL